MSTPVRVLLCDDQAVVRLRVRATVERMGGFQIVGEAATGAESVELSLAVKPDVVLMDVSLPDFSGVEATRQILTRAPDIRVLAFSSDSRKQTVDQMLSAGARGYVVKALSLAELVRAIQVVSAGGCHLDPNLT